MGLVGLELRVYISGDQRQSSRSKIIDEGREREVDIFREVEEKGRRERREEEVEKRKLRVEASLRRTGVLDVEKFKSGRIRNIGPRY